MVRTPSFDENGIKKGAWSPEEDAKLEAYITRYGHWNWRELPKFAGLQRCGKSCRLRWMNYLRPNVKRGNYSRTEEELIMELHKKHGNKWAMIAAKLPGRTDNEIKNHWHTHLKKRLRARDSSSLDERSQISLSGSESSAGSERSQKQVSSGGVSSTSNQASSVPEECLQHIQILESCPFSPQASSAGAVSLSSSSFTTGGIPIIQADTGLLSDFTSSYPISDCFFPADSTSLIYPICEDDSNAGAAELMAEASAAAAADGGMEDVFEELERIDVDFWTKPFQLEELSFYSTGIFSNQYSSLGYELMTSSYMSHYDETVADLF